MSWITLQEPRDPLHTMVCPISRVWAVEPWFDSFRQWWLPERTELLVIADTSDHAMQSRIRARLLEERHRLAGIRLLCTDFCKLPERGRGDLRKPRVVGHWERFLEAALAPIILAAEDDTLPDHDAYPRLLEIFHRTGAAYVQGTEVSRWSHYVIPHWRITERNGQVVRIETASYEGQDLVEIDGGGWYCCAIDRDKARGVGLSWTDDPPIGPDVAMVRGLRKSGEVCLGDWSIECEHWSDRYLHEGRMEIFHPSRTPLEAYVREPKPSGGWTLEIRPARGRNTPAEAQPAAHPAPPPAATTKKVEEKSMRVQFIQAVCFRGQDMRPGQEIDCPENMARALEFRKLARIVTSPQKVAPVAPVPVPAPAPEPAPPPAPVPAPAPSPVVATREPDPVPTPTPEPEPEPRKPQRARRSRAKKVA